MLKRLGLAAGAALWAGTALANPYAPYEGTTLVVMWPAHPHYDAAIEVLDQFTEETGIEVEVDQLEYLRMREKQTLELTKDEGDYDLISFVVFSKADYVYADQLENLAKYFMNPALADPSYDQSDLIDGYVQNIGVAGGAKGYLPGQLGSAFGIPFGSETSVLAYRKDIFEKHGLEPPETYEELLDLACRIPELEPGMGGMAQPRRVGPPGQPRIPAPPGAAGRPGLRRQLGAHHQRRGRRPGGQRLEDHRRLRPRGRHHLRSVGGSGGVQAGPGGDVPRFHRLRGGVRGSQRVDGGRKRRLRDASYGASGAPVKPVGSAWRSPPTRPTRRPRSC